MKAIGNLAALTAGLAACTTALCAESTRRPPQLEVNVTQNTQRLMPYQVFELTFQHLGEYRNPTWDVTINVEFTSPSGKKVKVGGFLYGSSKPQERISPENPFRFVFEDGSPYFPVGFQDGVFDGNHNGSAMDAKNMEGPFRPDPDGQRPTPPPGAMFARGPSMNPVNGDVYFGRHARAGFNMWRFSPNNFSIKVFTLDDVDWVEARMVDEMMRLLRKYDIRFFYGIFGFTKAFNDQPHNEQGMAKVTGSKRGWKSRSRACRAGWLRTTRASCAAGPSRRFPVRS